MTNAAATDNRATPNNPDEFYIHSGGQKSQSISIADERNLSHNAEILSPTEHFNEYRAFARRPSNRSNGSFRQDVEAAAKNSTALLSVGIAEPPEMHQPSIVFMDAIRRRSRVLLYNSKIPGGIKSMPQISQYDNGNNSSNNSNIDGNNLNPNTSNNSNKSEISNKNEDSNV